MRLVSLSAIAAAASLAVLSGVADADPATAAPSTKTFGYFNPQTHVFTPAPLPPVAPATDAPATTPLVRSGTVKFSVTVHLVSPIPDNAVFNPSFGAGVSDPDTATPPRYASSVGDVVPTVTRNGNTLKIAASLPYRFVYTVSSDQMFLTFFITDNASPSHSYSYNQSIEIPADGATTAISLTASL